MASNIFQADGFAIDPLTHALQSRAKKLFSEDSSAPPEGSLLVPPTAQQDADNRKLAAQNMLNQLSPIPPSPTAPAPPLLEQGAVEQDAVAQTEEPPEPLAPPEPAAPEAPEPGVIF